MASKAKAPSSAVDPNTPLQHAILLVQVEALHADDRLRDELHQKNFKIVDQFLVTLNHEDAQHFVDNIRNSASALYATTTDSEAGAASNATPTPTPPPSAPASSSSTPRDPATISENAIDTIAGLTAGPVLVLVVSKPNAIADLVELVGPPTPALWSTLPTTWRAQFGQDASRIGIRCSTQEQTVENERAFLLAHATSSTSTTATSTLHHQHKASSGATVSVEILKHFLFPPRLQHPNTTGRLMVLGLYGPLDNAGRLRSGEKGLHIVTDLELDTMADRMAREDILSIFALSSLSQQEEAEVLRQVDPVLKSIPMMTPRDLDVLLAPLSQISDGLIHFVDLQDAILRERARRLICMKDRILPTLATPIQNQYRRAMTRTRVQEPPPNQVTPMSMFLHDIGLTNAENASLVSRLLSTHSFKMCQMDDGNSPSLTQNVRLLREDAPLKHETRPTWNPNCAR